MRAVKREEQKGKGTVYAGSMAIRLTLLTRLVEGFRGRVSVGTQYLVLSSKHPLKTSHQASTLAVQVAVHLLLKSGFVEITRSDCDSHGNSLFQGFARDILMHGNARIDTSAGQELRSHSSSASLWCAENDINVLGRNNASLVLVDDTEAVREIEGLVFGEILAQPWPRLALCSVAEQIHEDTSLCSRFFNCEQILAGNPAVCHSFLPRLTVFADTNNDIHTIVTQIETLSVALTSVPELHANHKGQHLPFIIQERDVGLTRAKVSFLK